MNRKTFVVAASVSFLAAVLTSGAAQLDVNHAPLHLIQAVSLQ